MNFTDIKTTIADYLDRDDLTAGTLAFFINSAMRKLERKNNFNYMLKKKEDYSIIADTGVLTVPSDFKKELYFYLVVNDCKHFLEKRLPEEIEALYLVTNAPNNMPNHFAYFGSDIILRPVSDKTYTNKFAYYAFSSELSESNSTNWITANVPEILVFGGLLEAEPYLVNDERIRTWGVKFQEALDDLRQIDNELRLGE